MRRRTATLCLLTLLMGAQARAQSPAPHAATVSAIRASAAFATAMRALDAGHERYVDEIIRITQVPAPPFKEARRAELVRAMMQAHGLAEVAIDAEGNVLGLRAGTDAAARLVVVSAHLDTVFPEGTDVTVRRAGTRLTAPGVGDDSRGLATLFAYMRAMDAAAIRTRHPILFVGTVGEEGAGDLRGVRFLFTRGAYKDRVAAFFSIDGAGAARVTHRAVGSKRYRATFRGPGGHSYGAFGIVNPMAAMSAAVAELYRVKPTATPKTTYSASVTGGGTSVNAIPADVFTEFDMRSESPTELAALERRFLDILDAAVEAENAARSTLVGKVAVEPVLLGDRPAGSTSRDADIVRFTEEAVRQAGFVPRLDASSTDANLPMSLGIPSVTIGPGGAGERSHSLDEFIDVSKGETLKGMQAGLAAVLATADMQLR